MNATLPKLNAGIGCRIAFGPETPGWGSWNWIGADLADALEEWLPTSTFGWNEIPDAEVLVVVKHPLPVQVWRELSPETAIIYCPVDHYGSAADIDADRPWLRRCSRVLVHCERLRQYFVPHAPVEYLDHHVKFVSADFAPCPADGPILWVGVRTNIPPLAAWVNVHTLSQELLVLTNPESSDDLLEPAKFGFRSRNRIRIEVWTPERHLAWLTRASAALDIKGTDFRSWHKPPAKAIDFIASGLPLAMNADSSPVEHLARLGFEVLSPDDPDGWFSREYRDETNRFGRALRVLMSRERIVRRLRRIIAEVVGERVVSNESPLFVTC